MAACLIAPWLSRMPGYPSVARLTAFQGDEKPGDQAGHTRLDLSNSLAKDVGANADTDHQNIDDRYVEANSPDRNTAILQAVMESPGEKESDDLSTLAYEPALEGPAAVDFHAMADVSSVESEREPTIGADHETPRGANTVDSRDSKPRMSDESVASTPTSNPTMLAGQPKRVSPNPRLADFLSGLFSTFVPPIYLGGVVIVGLYHVAGMIAVARLRSLSVPAAPECEALLREVAGGAAKRGELLISDQVAYPFTFTFSRPVILLPQSTSLATDQVTRQHLRWCLAHE
jgi:hypothetical protein